MEAMAALRRCFASPVTTCTRQGWVLTPDAAALATARIASTSSRSTGVGRKARMLRRVTIAQSTASRRATSGIGGGGAKRFMSSDSGRRRIWQTSPGCRGQARVVRRGNRPRMLGSVLS